MNKYIKYNKIQEEEYCKTRGIIYDSDNIICLHGTDKEQQKQILDFSKSFASFIPTIDGIRKETKSYVNNKAKGKPAAAELESFHDDALDNLDFHRYINKLPDGYQLEKWVTGAVYYDKIYAIIRSELVGEEVSAFDNTMVLLGDDSKLPLSDLPIGSTSRSTAKGDDITFTLSQILANLKESNYTDTILIDLSCNAGYTDGSGRSLNRTGTIGGKKTKRKRKKSSKKKRKPKRTRKHRKK